MPVLSPDKPLTDPKDDRLGYAPFAKNLAESILKMIPPEGLVIAIYGQWGSGKSTVIEFIANYLEHPDEGASPLIVRFNPWWFSGSEDLVRHFFDELQVSLGNKLRSSAKALVTSVQRLSDVVSKVPLPGSELPKGIADTRASL